MRIYGMSRSIMFIVAMMLLFRATEVDAQGLDNTGTERSIASEKYIRLNYSNDYFTATDFYLTQAMQLEWVLPAFSKIPVYKIIYRPANSEVRYGLSLEHNAYTPVHYETAVIQKDDRPFAACFFLNMFAISTNSNTHQRVRTELSAGVIGKSAFGEGMQTFIHEHIGNAIPHGWVNQVRNDVILNYSIAYQKQIFAISDILNLTADATARLGTLSTKANIGITLMAGRFNNPFASVRLMGKKFQLYAYDHPEINAVGYDATLQGGLFNHSSPYTISTSDVTRFVFRNNWGFVLQTGRLYLEYYQSYMTKEFNTGMDFHNGGIQIGFAF
ncbi:lipid A deacylase LpxR family protein [Taibaiella lutea]|nr:lipid A deacylase LpxR family protein [Taibaiella lutea]